MSENGRLGCNSQSMSFLFLGFVVHPYLAELKLDFLYAFKNPDVRRNARRDALPRVVCERSGQTHPHQQLRIAHSRFHLP